MDTDNFTDLFLDIKPEELNMPDDDWFSNLNTDDLLTDVMSDNPKIKPLNVVTYPKEEISEDMNYSPPTVKSTKIQKTLSQSPQSCDSGLMCSDPDSNHDMDQGYANENSQDKQLYNSTQILQKNSGRSRKSQLHPRSSRSYLKESFKSEILDNYDSYKRHNNNNTNTAISNSLKRKDTSSNNSPSSSSISENETRFPMKYSAQSITSPYDSAEDDDLTFYESKSYYNSSGRHTPSHASSKNQPIFQNPIPQSGILILSEEEKKTMIAEGYNIPSRLPLTKQEERNLKKIRRKIKNKISAQESRRKKKEYLETLEKKVDSYSNENCELKRRVDTLESSNRSLLSQLRHLQQLLIKANNQNTKKNGYNNNNSNNISNSNTSKTTIFSPTNRRIQSVHSNDNSNTVESGAHASTCLMMFVLCFAVLLAGQGTPSGSKGLMIRSSSAIQANDDTSSSNSDEVTLSKSLANRRSAPDRQALVDLSFWTEDIDSAWSKIKHDSPDIMSIDEIYDATVGHGNENNSLKEEEEATALNRPQKMKRKMSHQDRSSTFVQVKKEKYSEDQPRILGSLGELEEYDESCEPPTIWSYLFGEDDKLQNTPKEVCNNEAGAMTNSSQLNNTRSVKSHEDQPKIEKRKIIKIYTHDEKVFKRYHSQPIKAKEPIIRTSLVKNKTLIIAKQDPQSTPQADVSNMIHRTIISSTPTATAMIN